MTALILSKGAQTLMLILANLQINYFCCHLKTTKCLCKILATSIQCL